MVRRHIHHLRRWVVFSCVVLIFLLAGVLSLGRWAMQVLPDYRVELAELISDEPAYRIEFDQLTGRWARFSPRLEASRVSLYLSGGRRVDIGRMELQLDSLRSLWHLEPVFNQILIDQVDLSLFRDQQGGWDLAGDLNGSPDSLPGDGQGNMRALGRSLFLHDQIEIRNGLVRVQFEGQAPLPPQLVNLQLRNQGDHHALLADLVLGAEQAIELKAVTEGWPGDSEFKARFAFNAPVLAEKFWNQFIANPPEELPHYQLGAQLWGRWSADGQHQLQGQFEVPALTLSRNEQQLQVQDLRWQLQLALQGLDQGELALTDIQGSIDGIELPLQRLSGRKQGSDWELSAQRLALEPLWRLVETLPWIDPTTKQKLQGLNPEGVLDNPRFEWFSAEPQQSPQFRFSADLNQVGVGTFAWAEGAPALKGVDGLLVATGEGGRVDFHSDGFEMEFPQIFSQGWRFDQAQGVVSWQISDQGVRVDSEHLQLRSDTVNADGRFSLDLPKDRQQDGRLVLMIGMHDADAGLTPLFVPDKVIDPNLFNWLQGAINAGQLHKGGLIYDLPIDRPNELQQAATLQMFYDVAEAEVQYQPDWPAIRHANPFVLIKGTELLIDLPAGQLLQTELTGGRIYLPPHSPVLQIDGQLNGPAADIRQTLIEGPTAKVLAKPLTPWALEGNSASHLNLGVDLNEPERSLIRVSSRLENAVLENTELGLRFDQLGGELSYHEHKGLSSPNLEAQLFGFPLQASIQTRKRADGDRTIISGRGTTSMQVLQDWLKQPLLEPLSGTTQYAARLEICAGASPCSNLRIDSQLKGVAIELPPPFGKQAGSERELGLDVSLDDTPWMRVRYDRQFDLLLPLSKEFSGAELVLGRDQTAPSRRRDGLWIRGHLPTVELEPWQAFFERTFAETTPSNRTTKNTTTYEVNALETLLRQVELRVDQFKIGDFSLDQLYARLRPATGHWQLALDSPLVRGQLLLPKTGVPQLELDYLQLPAADDANRSADKPTPPKPFVAEQDPLFGLNPSTLPALKVKLAQLRRGEQELGRWRFQFEPYADGLKVRDLNARMGTLTLTGAIDWRYQAGVHNTDVQLMFTTSDLGKVMQAWGSDPGIETKSAVIESQLAWDGSPLAFNWQTLDGEAEIGAGQGRILDTGEGAQVLKLFSLFNSKTIFRRLTLDFSDLTKKGISFDHITGRYRITDGNAMNLKPLELIGPTFDLTLEGSLDLYRETVNKTMQVTLPVSENLPVAAAFMATPQVAGAVFLFQKLFGKKLSKFTSVKYRIEGGWNNPKMELIQQHQKSAIPVTEK
ncbi:TIGR02099 family protein [Motiliproteus coralliicola]|uniref:TIGR02099 family protein n=1 Tax=Motiliproteus coralliicola TaxID=2283196 RepID=A0A369WES1_9GAMM|nr:YhdP family protein [Motiliproteus coralliicola]RDE19793.1 TIGR02099 family protein [Motiliproteus coralliicola]